MNCSRCGTTYLSEYVHSCPARVPEDREPAPTPVVRIRAFGPGVYEGDQLLLPTDGREVVAISRADVEWLVEVLGEFWDEIDDPRPAVTLPRQESRTIQGRVGKTTERPPLDLSEPVASLPGEAPPIGLARLFADDGKPTVEEAIIARLESENVALRAQLRDLNREIL